MDTTAHTRRAGSDAGRSERIRSAARPLRWSAWMAAAQGGDARSYEALLGEVRPVLQAYVRTRISSEAIAEDVVQTVLLLVHRARHSYRAERPFEPWLFAIARNAVVDFQRRGARRLGREEPLGEDETGSGMDARASEAMVPFPESSAVSLEIEWALSRLPANQREAVTLLHVEGLSIGEAAQRVGTTRGALKARIHRAYQALRGLLAGGAL